MTLVVPAAIDLSRELLMEHQLRDPLPPEMKQRIHGVFPPRDARWLVPMNVPVVQLHHVTELFQRERPDHWADTYAFFGTTLATLVYLEESTHVTLMKGLSSDVKNVISEAFGVSLACIWMNHVFGVRWETIEQVRRNGGKRPDFLGLNAAKERFVFEAKGGTSRSTQNKGIEDGKAQKVAYTGTAAAKLVLASCFRTPPSPPFSDLVIVDPPVSFDIDAAFSERNQMEYQKRHFLRAVSFSLGPSASRMADSGKHWGEVGTRSTWAREVETRTIAGREYYGRSVGMSEMCERAHLGGAERLQGMRFFWGIERRTYDQGIEEIVRQKSPYALRGAVEPRQIVRHDGEVASILSDGSALQVTV